MSRLFELLTTAVLIAAVLVTIATTTYGAGWGAGTAAGAICAADCLEATGGIGRMRGAVQLRPSRP